MVNIMNPLPENMLRALCGDNPAIFTETISALYKKNPALSPDDRFRNIETDKLKAIVENISRKIEASVEIANGMIHFLPVKGLSIYGISVSSSKIFCPRNY
jgi:hypothetical protein